MKTLVEQIETLNKSFEYSNITTVIKDRSVHISFYTDWSEAEFITFQTFINTEKFAPYVGSLKISGTDEGINGTRNWEMAPMAENNVIFDRLQIFEIEGNRHGCHNRTIVTGDDSYEENGVIARVVAKMPGLTYLQIPSAPNRSFFDLPLHSLKTLKVQAGYDAQDFIKNIAGSTSLGNLEHLEFTDYSETYMDNFEDRQTDLMDYLELFDSNTLNKLKELIIINSKFSADNTDEIKSTRLGKQLSVLEITNLSDD